MPIHQHSPVVVALTIISVTSALASAIGSSTIIATILRSSQKLANPYRRIIFGMSCFDILQSLSFVMAVFRTDPVEKSWHALGNPTSCQLFGFFLFAGHNGTLFYSLSLNIFYLCLVKYRVKRDNFCHRIEPFLHGVPIAWAFTSASYIVAAGYMNPGASPDRECFIRHYPEGCLHDRNIECIRGQHADLFRVLFHFGPIILTYLGIILTLGILWHSVNSLERRMERHRMRSSVVSVSALRRKTSRTQSDAASIPRSGLELNTVETIEEKPNKIWQTMVTSRIKGSNTNSHKPFQRSLRRRKKSRPFLVQAKWYSIVFFIVYLFPVIVTVRDLARMPHSVILLFLAKVFNPLQGALNIIVYTRPHVANELSRNPNMSWWGAFKKVIKSGGDDGAERTNRLRRGSAVPVPVAPC